jgi:hypothetical protein
MVQASVEVKAKKLVLRCEHCEERIRVPASYAGRKGKCPGCKGTIRIPGEPRARAPRAARSRGGRGGVAEPTRDRDVIECPMCSEVLRASALKCRHCEEWLDEDSRDEDEEEEGQTLGEGVVDGIDTVFKFFRLIKLVVVLAVLALIVFAKLAGG